MGLLLKVTDVDHDGLSWRWTLTDEGSGAALADHSVILDPADPLVGAFTDLYRYLRWNADPDRRAKSEAAIVHRLGVWVAEQVLGESVCVALAAAAPVSHAMARWRWRSWPRRCCAASPRQPADPRIWPSWARRWRGSTRPKGNGCCTPRWNRPPPAKTIS